jgi:hypothetical protein
MVEADRREEAERLVRLLPNADDGAGEGRGRSETGVDRTEMASFMPIVVLNISSMSTSH